VVVEQLPVGVAQVAHFLPSAFAGAIDKAATARLATMRDNAFIAFPFQVAGRTCRPKAYDNTVQLSVATSRRAQGGNRSADFLEVRELDSMSPFVKVLHRNNISIPVVTILGSRRSAWSAGHFCCWAKANCR